jgi:hypothetical protein
MDYMRFYQIVVCRSWRPNSGVGVYGFGVAVTGATMATGSASGSG